VCPPLRPVVPQVVCSVAREQLALQPPGPRRPLSRSQPRASPRVPGAVEKLGGKVIHTWLALATTTSSVSPKCPTTWRPLPSPWRSVRVVSPKASRPLRSCPSPKATSEQSILLNHAFLRALTRPQRQVLQRFWICFSPKLAHERAHPIAHDVPAIGSNMTLSAQCSENSKACNRWTAMVHDEIVRGTADQARAITDKGCFSLFVEIAFGLTNAVGNIERNGQQQRRRWRRKSRLMRVGHPSLVETNKALPAGSLPLETMRPQGRKERARKVLRRVPN
jgi:hypothetical protein